MSKPQRKIIHQHNSSSPSTITRFLIFTTHAPIRHVSPYQIPSLTIRKIQPHHLHPVIRGFSMLQKKNKEISAYSSNKNPVSRGDLKADTIVKLTFWRGFWPRNRLMGMFIHAALCLICGFVANGCNFQGLEALTGRFFARGCGWVWGVLG